MIHSFAWAQANIGQSGMVIKSSRSVALVQDLGEACLGESVCFASGHHGMVSSLGVGQTEVMVFADEPIAIGEECVRTGQPLKISVGDGMLGDSFDALGYITSVDKEPSKHSENRPLEVEAGTLETRAEIKQFLATGVTVVDMVIPIARGQRELIIGDQRTGKTGFALTAVKTQAKLGTICVLGLIGKEQSHIQAIKAELTQAGVMDKCIIVAEPARASAARITLVPFTAMTIAEHFRDQGQNTLVVLDDLTYHAVRYREMALLSDRFPGRDSYPSDIFYLHSRLLERAGSFKSAHGSGAVSITCLPVCTTVDGDIASYIQTNLMSMTDGHLYFDKNLFFDGVRPAVNIFLSVTRVGRQTQTQEMRQWGQKILTTMSHYADLKRFLRFGAELSSEIQESIRLAHGLKELLKQAPGVSLPIKTQIANLEALWKT